MMRGILDDQESILDKILETSQRYAEAIKSRAKEISGAYNLFADVEKKETATAQEAETPQTTLTMRLGDQVTQLEKWRTALNSLRKRGVAKGLMSELYEQGPEATEQIEELAGMNSKELKYYQSLWKQRNKISKEQAEVELDGMEKKTDKRLASLYDKLNKTSSKKGSVIGVDMIRGIISGIESKTSALNKAIANAMEGATKTAKKSLKIASPSKVFAEIGRFMDDGAIEGIKSRAGAVNSAMEDLFTPPRYSPYTPACAMPNAAPIAAPARETYTPAVEGLLRELVNVSKGNMNVTLTADSRELGRTAAPYAAPGVTDWQDNRGANQVTNAKMQRRR